MVSSASRSCAGTLPVGPQVFGEVQHRGQGIVQLVRHTRGDPSDRRETLVMERLRLGPLQLLVRVPEVGLVAADPHRHAVERVRQRGHFVAPGESDRCDVEIAAGHLARRGAQAVDRQHDASGQTRGEHEADDQRDQRDRGGGPSLRRQVGRVVRERGDGDEDRAVAVGEDSGPVLKGDDLVLAVAAGEPPLLLLLDRAEVGAAVAVQHRTGAMARHDEVVGAPHDEAVGVGSQRPERRLEPGITG